MLIQKVSNLDYLGLGFSRSEHGILCFSDLNKAYNLVDRRASVIIIIMLVIYVQIGIVRVQFSTLLADSGAYDTFPLSHFSNDFKKLILITFCKKPIRIYIVIYDKVKLSRNRRNGSD